jgi:hypothetical protein
MGEPMDIPGEWIKALRDLPPPPLREDRDPAKTACVCGAFVNTASCHVAYSGYVNYVVALCSQCRKDLKDYARVICPKCKTLALLIKPHRDPHGFTMLQGRCYHVEHCPTCRPGTDKAPIIEKLLFYKERHLPYDVPRNLQL